MLKSLKGCKKKKSIGKNGCQREKTELPFVLGVSEKVNSAAFMRVVLRFSKNTVLFLSISALSEHSVMVLSKILRFCWFVHKMLTFSRHLSSNINKE